MKCIASVCKFARLVGLLMIITAFDSPARYYYDADNRLERIQSSQNQNVYYNYDTNGNVITKTSQKPGAAIFDGVDDIVSLGSLGARPSQGTLEFWMNSDEIANFRNPISTNPGNTGIRFEQSATGDSLSVVIGDDWGNYNSFVYRGHSNPIVSGVWYHVALVWDSSQNQVWGYLNGELVFSGMHALWSTVFTQVNLGSGFDMSPSRSFMGKIRDFRIWNVGRTASQIANGMHNVSSNEIGLAGRWLVNEGFGTTVYEVSGKGNNGQAFGVEWVREPQQILSFDGVDDRVIIGSLGPRPMSGTIEFWMNPNEITNYRNALSTDLGNVGIRFEQSATANSLEVVIGDDMSNYSSHIYRGSSNPLVTGTWYHVALAWDSGQNKVWGYLNGEQVFEDTQTFWSTNLNQITLGSGFDMSPSRSFKGTLRDVRVWSVARSAGQVANGMHAVSSNEAGLVGHWLMNEGLGALVYEHSGRGNNGIISGAGWVPEPGQALSFDGLDDKVTIGPMGPRPVQGTLEFWMNSRYVSDYRNPLSINDWNTGIRFEQSATGDSLTVAIGDESGQFSPHVYRSVSNPIIPGSWYHVALVWDSLQNKVWGYLNGELVFDDTQMLWSNNLNKIVLGSGLDMSPSRSFKGKLRDIRMWNVARSAGQVISGMQGVSSNEAGLIGRWLMNEGFGTTVFEVSGKAYNGLISGSGWVPEPSVASKFDGVDDKVAIGSIGARPVQGTIEFWMNSSDVANYRNPLSTNGGNVGIRFEQSTQGDSLAVVIGDDWSQYTSHTYRSNSNPIHPHAWYHVALVWDSSQNKVWGYLNGQLMFADTQTHWNTSFSQMTLGSGLDMSPTRSFKGKLRDVRLWNTVRNQEQIHAGTDRISSNHPGLLHRWELDEGFGSIATDSTIQGKHGLITGALWGTSNP